MQFIACHNGQLQRLSALEQEARGPRPFRSGLAALDTLSPGGAFARGAVHELLWDGAPPLRVALLLAQAAARGSQEPISPRLWDSTAIPNPPSTLHNPFIWSDPAGQLYPPALAATGVPLDRLYLLRPASAEDELWALAECLRCRGVGATVAAVSALSPLAARRLQLAAEVGGGVGLLLRRHDRYARHYAAATRWLIEPVIGERTVQRWKIQLVHGHGGQIGQSVLLEYSRDTRHLCARQYNDWKDRLHPAAPMAHRPRQARSA